MENDFFLVSLIAIISGTAAYQAYTNQGILSAFIVLFVVSWVLYGLRSEKAFIKYVKSIFNPLIVAIAGLFIGFSYYALKGLSFKNSVLWSIPVLLFGVIFSMLVYKYWNIGSH